MAPASSATKAASPRPPCALRSSRPGMPATSERKAGRGEQDRRGAHLEGGDLGVEFLFLVTLRRHVARVHRRLPPLPFLPPSRSCPRGSCPPGSCPPGLALRSCRRFMTSFLTTAWLSLDEAIKLLWVRPAGGGGEAVSAARDALAPNRTGKAGRQRQFAARVTTRSPAARHRSPASAPCTCMSAYVQNAPTLAHCQAARPMAAAPLRVEACCADPAERCYDQRDVNPSEADELRIARSAGLSRRARSRQLQQGGAAAQPVAAGCRAASSPWRQPSASRCWSARRAMSRRRRSAAGRAAGAAAARRIQIVHPVDHHGGQPPRGQVTLACIPTAAFYFLPRVIRPSGQYRSFRWILDRSANEGSASPAARPSSASTWLAHRATTSSRRSWMILSCLRAGTIIRSPRGNG